jgi:lysophospholipase L1-like esterase
MMARKLVGFGIYLIVISGAMIELVGRQIWVSDGKHLYWKGDRVFRFDHELNYTLRPGFRMAGSKNRLYPGVDLDISRLGLRSPEVDKRSKILLVGDSVVFGYGVAGSTTMSSRLEDLMRGDYQVINGGVPGYNFEQVIIWTKRLVSVLEPRIVIYVINANDLQSRYYPTLGGATVSGFRSYPWQERLPEERPMTVDPFTRSVLLAVIRGGGIQELPRSVPPMAEENGTETAAFVENERQQLRFWNSDAPWVIARREDAISATRVLVHRLSNRGIKVLLAFYPWRVSVEDPTATDRHRTDWMLRAAQDKGAGVLDLLPALRAARTQQSQWLKADSHPNEAGHQTIAAALALAVERLVRERP